MLVTESTLTGQSHSIVEINLDLSDETTEERNEDDENSLPEIFFKRIIAPECKCSSIDQSIFDSPLGSIPSVYEHPTRSRPSINKRSHSKKKSLKY